jgi:hypothetical protein
VGRPAPWRALPFTVLTMGLGLLALNGGVILKKQIEPTASGAQTSRSTCDVSKLCCIARKVLMLKACEWRKA